MTIAYPDVSNHEGAMPLEAGTVAVCAKASEGTGYIDPYYGHYRSEAQRVGAVFFAYHFLHAGNGAAQADHCFSVTGPGVNAMIDHEPTRLPDGTLSVPSVQDAVDFAVRYRQRGGLCTVDYLPHWYWSNPIGSPDGGMGSPSLAPFATAGLSLISSSYTTYSDTGPGWAGYGGLSPVIWQYTDALPYSGQSVDFNAYRGTVDQLRALLGYQGAQMEQTDKVVGSMARGNTVGDVLADLSNWRDEWYLAPGTASNNPPPPGSRAALLFAAVDDIHAKVSALASPTVDPAAVASAVTTALADPALLKALAHAVAVELHNDTPAT